MTEINDLTLLASKIEIAGATAEEVFQYVRGRLIVDTRELAKKADQALDSARMFNVTDAETAIIAANHVRTIKTDRETLNGRLGDMKDKAHKVHKAVISAMNVVSDPLDRAEKSYNNKIAQWRERERVKAQEIQRELAEDARKRREALYAKARKSIDKLTSEIGGTAERIVALEELRDRPDTTNDEMDAINGEINTLTAILDGKHAALQEKHDTVVASSLPEPSEAPAALPKLEGVTETYEYEVTVYNKRQLLHAILESNLPLDAVDENMGKLKALAKMGMKLPGCNVTKKPKVNIRRT